MNKKYSEMFRTKKMIAVLVLTGSLVLSWNCRRGKTEQDKIKDMIESVEEFVEKKYISSILDQLTEDFYDMEDRTKKEIEELLIKYYDRHTGIVLHILGTRFLKIGNNLANIETEVSLSSGTAKFFRKIIKYYGETYRFTLTLVKMNKQWKINYAEWRYISLEQLFPESFKILKKIFPKL